MAVTKLHEASNEGTTSALTVTITAATAGNLLVLWVYNSNFAVTHTLTAGWTKAVNKLTDSVTNGAIWYKVAAGGETSVVITASGGTPLIDAYCAEFDAGTAWSSPLDQIDDTAENSAASVVAGPTSTTSQADELVAACGAHSGSIATSHAWSDSFTNLYSGGGTNHRLGAAYKILAATGTPQTTESWTTSRFNNACEATFKIPSSAVNANAGVAAATGAANAAAPSEAPNAGAGTSTGAAPAPAAKLAPNSGAGTATGAAGGPSSTVATPAGIATATGASAAPAPSVAPNAGSAAATGAAHNASVTAIEYQRPISDISAGSWTVAPLWSKVDEVVVDDSDLITSETLVAPGNTSNADLRLNSRGDPLSSSGHVISVRAKVTFTLGINGGIRAELRQGNNVTSTLIATLTTDALTTSFVTYTYTLSGAEADSITDYGDLFLRVYGNFPVGSLGGVTVSWVQFQQPAGIVPVTSVYPDPATAVGAAYNAAPSEAVNAGIGSSIGAAYAAGPSIAANAGVASATAAAGSVTAGDVTSNASTATATAAALAPAPAEAPTAGTTGASGAASAPSAALAPTTGTGTATGAAGGPSSTVAAGAGAATASSVASSPAPAEAVHAGVSTATGAALDASTSSSVNVQAFAGVAEATAAALGPSVSIASSAGVTVGTGAALAPAPSVAPNAGTTTGAGAANGATTGNVTATAGSAAGTGAAPSAAPSLAPNTGNAASSGAAGGPTSTVTTTAGIAAGSGAAYNAQVVASAALVLGYLRAIVLAARARSTVAGPSMRTAVTSGRMRSTVKGDG